MSIEPVASMASTNSVGRDQPELRVHPPDQRLDADQFALGQIELGLVVHDDPALLDGLPELGDQLEPPAVDLADARPVDLRAVRTSSSPPASPSRRAAAGSRVGVLGHSRRRAAARCRPRPAGRPRCRRPNTARPTAVSTGRRRRSRRPRPPAEQHGEPVRLDADRWSSPARAHQPAPRPRPASCSPRSWPEALLTSPSTSSSTTSIPPNRRPVELLGRRRADPRRLRSPVTESW